MIESIINNKEFKTLFYIKQSSLKKKDRCGFEPPKCIELSIALSMHYQTSFAMKVL